MSKFNWGTKACGVFLLSATAALALPSQTTADGPTETFTTLHSFDEKDGKIPLVGLVQGTDGNFYGTTPYGGANSSCDYGAGCGTIFKITPSGTLTTLYNFCSQGGRDCTDGNEPAAGLVQGTDGSFYGTTYSGGSFESGNVFKITPSGKLTSLHTFCPTGYCTDGANPETALIQATDGNFYGTTIFGGAGFGFGGCFPVGCGTVFKITPNGKFTKLHNFYNSGGTNPTAGLVQAADGKFYGTTLYGGTVDDGTVFEITSSGKLTTLYSFCSETNCPEGAEPIAGLVEGTDGNFYGITRYGGANGGGCVNLGCGTAFKITSTGKLTTLYAFCSQPSGTICSDGEYPYAALIQGTNGKFYGTASVGGANNDCPMSFYNYAGCGTVFSLSVGLGPFVETQPTSGKAGKAVEILGTDLTGATSVTFNGTAAAFTVKSKSEITTAVPTGATTGTVQVVTPGRTLSSNVPFRVTH
jgi:uncharacterized repeat protein (TIGR03803 family)